MSDYKITILSNSFLLSRFFQSHELLREFDTLWNDLSEEKQKELAKWRASKHLVLIELARNKEKILESVVSL